MLQLQLVPAQGLQGEAGVSAAMVQQVLTRALRSLPFNMARFLLDPDQVGIALALICKRRAVGLSSCP